MEPLAVEITSDDPQGVTPATFEFDADATGGAEPYTYSWDFDGENIEEIDDDETEYTFDDAGMYNVGLTVNDSEGRSRSGSMEIVVEEAPLEEVEEQALAVDEEDDNSGSDNSFDLDDFLDRLEPPNNVVIIGGTSADDDYVTTGDD
jgi:PKD repeat protein